MRGSELDETIDTLLAQMISLGVEVAPISRSAVQRRLGLMSRATLVGDRGRRIDSARATQLRESGRDPDNARRRKSVEERIKRLEEENIVLLKQRDQLYEALANIVHRCLVKGLDVEDMLLPLARLKGI